MEETRRDANHALEELNKARDNMDERLGRVAALLKSLETAAPAGPSAIEVPSSDSVKDNKGRESRRKK